MGYAVVLLPLATGWDPFVVGRILNAALLLGSSLLCMSLAARALASRPAPERAFFAALAGVIQLSAWRGLGPAANLKADPLALFLVLLSARLFIARPERARLAATLGLLCALTKQSGVTFLGAALGTLGLQAFLARAAGAASLREAKLRLGRFLLTLAAGALLAIGALELLHAGRFLQDTLLEPARRFAQPAWLSGEHLLRLWEELCPNGLSLAALLAIPGALFAARRLRSEAWASLLLGLLALEVALVVAPAGRFVGAGTPYLWVAWSLLSVLAAIGAGGALAALPRFPSASAVAGAALLAEAALSAGVPLFQATPPDLGPALEANRRHQEQVARLIARAPGARWLAIRGSAAQARQGRPLEIEMCNFGFAFAREPAGPGYRALLERLENGDFRFVQTGDAYPCGQPLELAPALERCFRKVSESAIAPWGRITPVTIWEHAGEREPCRPRSSAAVRNPSG